MSWWQDLVDKIKDAITPDPPAQAPGTDQQHGAPLAPDPAAPNNAGVADPNDPGKAPPPPPPPQEPYRNQDIGDAGAPQPGSSSIPGGIGTEPNTGTGMTDEVAPAVGTLAAGVAVAGGVIAGAAVLGAGAGAGAAAGEGGTVVRTIGQLATAEGVLVGAAPDGGPGPRTDGQQQPAAPEQPANAPAKADPTPTPSNSQGEDSSGGVPATSGSDGADSSLAGASTASLAAASPIDDFALPGPEAAPDLPGLAAPDEEFGLPTPDSGPLNDSALPAPDSAPIDDFSLPAPDSAPSDDFSLPGPDSAPSDDFSLPGPDSQPDLPDLDAIGAGPGDQHEMGMG